MAVTLADVAKQSTQPLQKGILLNLLRYSDVLGILPFETAAALDNIVVRWAELPSVASRKIGGAYTESTGTTEQLTEAIRPMGGDVDVDKILEALPNVLEKPSVTQLKMKTKALAFYFNYLFIKGGPTVDADAFNGLEYRVEQLNTARPGQKLVIGTMGTPYDPTVSTATEHVFIDKLIELDDLVGGASAFFCNKGVRQGVGRVLRRANVLDVTRDQYNRTVFEYNGAPIIDIGLRANKVTEIILNTEDPGDGGADTTSMYAVRFGQPEGLVGVQLNQLEAYLVANELQAQPSKRWRIDWVCGLAGFGDDYAARLYNLAAPSAWT